jgi:hypothetical protein
MAPETVARLKGIPEQTTEAGSDGVTVESSKSSERGIPSLRGLPTASAARPLTLARRNPAWLRVRWSGFAGPDLAEG